MKRKKALITVGVLALFLASAGGYALYQLGGLTSKVASGGVLGLLTSSKLAGEDAGRVNILLAGNSADDPGHGGADLTDSIMVVSINTTSHTAFIVSIPRDLWVDVPGYGYEKINAAYPQGGMPLLKEVVQSDFGLTINYTTLINYTAFKQAVDAVGGIDVTIASSDPRGIYDPNITTADGGPLILSNGAHHLDGQTALNLARARNDPTPSGLQGYGLPNGDFDRSANQRLMLEALAKKIATTSVLTNPSALVSLAAALGNNVSTSFSTSELRRLFDVLAAVKPANIESVSLTGGSLLASYIAPGGASALIPSAGLNNYSAIQQYIQVFATSATAA